MPYKEDDPPAHNARTVIESLVDIVSKNGNLLMNVELYPDGSIPDPQRRILEEVGAWLRINGEAIYDTRPWKVYGEGPTRIDTGSFSDNQRRPFTGRDIRFTAKGEVLYATLLAWPENDEALIQSLGANLRLYPGEIGSVALLGSGETLTWSRTARGLRVKLTADRKSVV